MHGIFASCISYANSDSESMSYTRTYHSNRLSFTSSTLKFEIQRKCETWNKYRKKNSYRIYLTVNEAFWCCAARWISLSSFISRLDRIVLSFILFAYFWLVLGDIPLFWMYLKIHQNEYKNLFNSMRAVWIWFGTVCNFSFAFFCQHSHIEYHYWTSIEPCMSSPFFWRIVNKAKSEITHKS